MEKTPTDSTSIEVKKSFLNRYFLGSLWALGFLVFTALPPVMIENASRSSRVTWFIFLAIFSAVGVCGMIGASFSGNEIKKPKENYPLLPYLMMLLFYAAAVAFSLLIANLTNGSDSIASAARTMTNFVEPVFPWISNFRVARVGWGIPELQILKTESITALWFLFGVLLVLLLFWQRILLTSAQKEYERQYAEESMRNEGLYKSGTLTFFVVVFGFLTALSEFFGWLNFDTDSAKCILSVHCYYENDLVILAAAGLKCFAIFGGIAGALIIARNFFAQPL
ncbi:MAG: hypothetical protein ABL936_10175 [Aestuariivirga sp.]